MNGIKFYNDLDMAISCVTPADSEAMRLARVRMDSIAKPLNSLGELEGLVVRLAGMGRLKEMYRKAVVVACADNGVVQEGVTQTGQEITAKVAQNMAQGVSTVCIMSRVAGADVYPFDFGMAVDVEGVPSPYEGLGVAKMPGTRNIAREPAMSRDMAACAVLAGINLVGRLKGEGYDMLATGEMGIGNTTTSAAMSAVLLGQPAEMVTGKGAGLSDEGLVRKIGAVKAAIEVNVPNPNDPLDVLRCVGGLDIAGMAGVFLGGAIHGLPIVMDGLISGIAALVAYRLAPYARDYMLASHLSKEPAARLILEELGLRPLLSIGMALGEGTGAVSVMPLIDMALKVYHEMPLFDEYGMEAYKPL
jgi:nicotinate-nucleotide--dimethylbenzimidazole phosphoribosyltransferase